MKSDSFREELVKDIHEYCARCGLMLNEPCKQKLDQVIQRLVTEFGEIALASYFNETRRAAFIKNIRELNFEVQPPPLEQRQSFTRLLSDLETSIQELRNHSLFVAWLEPDFRELIVKVERHAEDKRNQINRSWNGGQIERSSFVESAVFDLNSMYSDLIEHSSVRPTMRAKTFVSLMAEAVGAPISEVTVAKLLTKYRKKFVGTT